MGRLPRLVLAALALAVLGAGAWVRLAPDDPARWHTDPARGQPGPNSARAEVPLALPPAEALAALDAVAMATPRTRRLAGSAAEGRITYVTRSALWGFPDYTTVAAEPEGAGSRLLLHARSRYGRSDLGVNAARLRDWLDRLAAATGGSRGSVRGGSRGPGR